MSGRKLSAQQAKRLRRLVGRALRRLDDRHWLAESRLARLQCVRQLAAWKYAGRYLPEGLALKEILEAACRAAQNEFSGLSVQILDTVLNGGAITTFASRRGLGREKLHYRAWQPILDYLVDHLLGLEEGRPDAA